VAVQAVYVTEAGSETVRALVQEAAIVATSGIAYPEARAAFARCRREGVIRPQAFVAAKRAFEEDWARYLLIEVTAPLCRRAGDLAERYRLRGYDSVHLASFIEVASRAGVRGSRFSSFDRRLERAARAVRRALARDERSRTMR
jgi:predicted nucleic acid-binding protein